MLRRYPLLLLVWCGLLGFAPLALAHTPVVGGDATAEGSAASAFDLTAYRSHHYLIHTNLTREETVPFGRHMDAVFEQYERRFRGFVQRELAPMPLYLLRTREDYVAFMAEHDIDSSNSGGLFFVTHSLNGLATWAESSSRPRTFRVLQHEGFHQFAWNYIGPNLPVWVNEGLAQYFEDAVLVDGRMAAGLTHRGRIDRVRRAIEGGHTLTLSRLNGVSSRVWNLTLRERPESAAVLYAQSWSVVYYLIHGDDGAHQARFVEYLKLLNQGNGEEEAMLLAFGREGVTSIEADWRRHARDQQPDDLTLATERLEFLGTGLRLLNEEGEPAPGSIDQLHATLRQYGFRMQRQEMGVSRVMAADDPSLFSFVRGSGSARPYTAEFQMLAPSRGDLPPRIVAPGLSPEPTLIWHRDAEGHLVQDISYR